MQPEHRAPSRRRTPLEGVPGGRRTVGLACAALGLPLLLTPALGAADGPSAYREALESFLIARHCALADEVVTAGFRIRIHELHAAGVVSGAEAQRYREEVWELVRRTWRNRGRGARDPRCLTRGREAAARLRAVVEDG